VEALRVCLAEVRSWFTHLEASETASRPGTRGLTDKEWWTSLESRDKRREAEEKSAARKIKLRERPVLKRTVVVREYKEYHAEEIYGVRSTLFGDTHIGTYLCSTLTSAATTPTQSDPRSVWNKAGYFWPVRGAAWSGRWNDRKEDRGSWIGLVDGGSDL
jgi:hypothetical protein